MKYESNIGNWKFIKEWTTCESYWPHFFPVYPAEHSSHVKPPSKSKEQVLLNLMNKRFRLADVCWSILFVNNYWKRMEPTDLFELIADMSILCNFRKLGYHNSHLYIVDKNHLVYDANNLHKLHSHHHIAENDRYNCIFDIWWHHWNLHTLCTLDYSATKKKQKWESCSSLIKSN